MQPEHDVVFTVSEVEAIHLAIPEYLSTLQNQLRGVKQGGTHPQLRERAAGIDMFIVATVPSLRGKLRIDAGTDTLRVRLTQFEVLAALIALRPFSRDMGDHTYMARSNEFMASVNPVFSQDALVQNFQVLAQEGVHSAVVKLLSVNGTR